MTNLFSGEPYEKNIQHQGRPQRKTKNRRADNLPDTIFNNKFMENKIVIYLLVELNM